MCMNGSLGGCLGNATGKSKIKQKPDLNMVIDKKTQFYMTEESKNVTNNEHKASTQQIKSFKQKLMKD